jgi:hypothetical protein
VAAEAGLGVRGFVLSQPAPQTDESAATNAETIASLTGLPILAELARGPVAPAVAARLAERVLDSIS